MGDFSMCNSKGCRKAKTCYRHPESGRVAGEYQWWIDIEITENCEYYWPVVEIKKEKACLKR